MAKPLLRILEKPDEMLAVEELQRLVWPGSDRDIVPAHLLLAAVHNGGLLIGAFLPETAAENAEEQPTASATLVGFVFGFTGLYKTQGGYRPKHYSHMLGVHPDYRNLGIGFLLKRAQWQMVRRQGLDLITWTYDPLLSRNAHLNIQKLGAVCNTYLREAYGEMRDELNAGLPSDRFQVDWWVNTSRVNRRLSRHARRPLDLAHFFAAGVQIINPSYIEADGQPRPAKQLSFHPDESDAATSTPLVLVEIPADFNGLRKYSLDLGLEWRMHTRSLFEYLFRIGYIVTDFVYLPGTYPRSFYALSHGDSTL